MFRFRCTMVRRSYAQYKEETSARIVDSGRTISATFLAAADNLGKTDRIELMFGHGEYPVTLMFASRAPYLDNQKAEAPRLLHSGALGGKLSPRRLSEDLFLYEVSFCRDVYRRDMSSKDLKQFAAGLPDSNWEEYFRKVFPNLVAYAQRIEVGRRLGGGGHRAGGAFLRRLKGTPAYLQLLSRRNSRIVIR